MLNSKICGFCGEHEYDCRCGDAIRIARLQQQSRADKELIGKFVEALEVALQGHKESVYEFRGTTSKDGMWLNDKVKILIDSALSTPPTNAENRKDVK